MNHQETANEIAAFLGAFGFPNTADEVLRLGRAAAAGQVLAEAVRADLQATSDNLQVVLDLVAALAAWDAAERESG